MRCQHAGAGAVVLLVLALVVWPWWDQAQPASEGSGHSAPGASVFFPEKAFEFQPVIDGVKVLHDFIVMNQGKAPLVISNVRTG
jgi:hypothetical protein